MFTFIETVLGCDFDTIWITLWVYHTCSAATFSHVNLSLLICFLWTQHIPGSVIAHTFTSTSLIRFVPPWSWFLLCLFCIQDSLPWWAPAICCRWFSNLFSIQIPLRIFKLIYLLSYNTLSCLIVPLWTDISNLSFLQFQVSQARPCSS